MARKKFLELIKEFSQGPAERDTIVAGDIFVFNAGYEKHDDYKSLDDKTKELLKSWDSSGKHIVVVGFEDMDKHQHIPSAKARPARVVLAIDEGGQRWGTERVIVPSTLGGRDLTIYPNLPPIPKEWKYDNKVQIKPVEYEADKETTTRKTDDGKGKMRDTGLKMPTKKSKLPNEKGPKQVDYMKGVK
jgi:hypothetical protein